MSDQLTDGTPDDLTADLAAALRTARLARELSVNALADASGVSRAMITKVEQGTAQPTAALLGRLTAALGITLSELFTQAEGGPAARLARAADQPTWTDPETGYRRRSVSPPNGSVQLVEVELPGRAKVGYPTEAFTFTRHQIWVLDGDLRFHEGDQIHDLHAGDCLELGAPRPCAYENPGLRSCRYLVALTRRPA